MRHQTGSLAILGSATLLFGPAAATAQGLVTTDAKPKHVRVMNAEGKDIGTAVFEQTPSGVLISVALSGLPAGEHGFHIHEKGVCDTADGFKTAGGHFAPMQHQHGFKVAGGPHAGDMPNQFVGSDGTLRAHVLAPNVTLKAGASSLVDADGSALVIHAGADDYRTAPSGDAGGRIACAVISPPKSK